MAGWESLGALLGGGVDRQGAFDQGQLHSAKTTEAIAKAKQERDRQAAIEEFSRLPPEAIAAAENRGVLMRSGMGQQFAATGEGYLRQQEYDNRTALGDALTTPEQKANASFAVQGKYEPLTALGAGGVVDIRNPDQGVQNTALGESMIDQNTAQAALSNAKREHPELYRASPKAGGSEPLVAVQTPEGPVLLPRSQASGKTPAVAGGAMGKVTADSQSAAGYFDRMKNAESLLGTYEPSMTDFAASGSLLNGGAATAMLANGVMSKEGQSFYQAAADWVRAKLRKESGAVIGEDEMQAEIRTYFPLPGEGPELRLQKAKARAIALAGMERTGAASLRNSHAPPTPPAAAAAAPEQTATNAAGEKLVLRNGQWQPLQ